MYQYSHLKIIFPLYTMVIAAGLFISTEPGWAGEIPTVLSDGWILTKEDRHVCTMALTKCLPVIEKLRENQIELKQKGQAGLDAVESELDRTDSELRNINSELYRIYNSTSWKYTRLFRYASELLSSGQSQGRSDRLFMLKKLLDSAPANYDKRFLEFRTDRILKKEVLFAHAPRSLSITVNPGAMGVTIGFGMMYTSYSHENSGDGVTFVVAGKTSKGEIMELARHHLDPQKHDDDKKEQNFRILFNQGRYGELILGTDPGPNSAADHSYWSYINYLDEMDMLHESTVWEYTGWLRRLIH